MEHVLYEMWMYIATYKHMQSESEGDIDTYGEFFTHNLLWESHMIHLRSMLFFFDKPNNYTNNRNIYVNNIVKKPERFYLDSINADVKNKISQSIAHLSKDRIEFDKDAFCVDVYELWEKLHSLIYEFTTNLNDIIVEDYIEDLNNNYYLITNIQNEIQH